MSSSEFEQANMMLRLYELRREPRLRQARAWVVDEFSAASPEEMMQKYPPGSEESTNIRMAVSYWDMAAGIANRGLVDDDLFFEHGGEGWLVWERMKAIVPGWRAGFKNPLILGELEKFANRLEAWREKRAPGSTEAMRQMFQQMVQARAKSAGG